MNTRDIIVFTDAATDDMFALLYLFCLPFINIRAIINAGTGESRGLAGANNLANLCYTFGKKIPIAYGDATSCENSGHEFPKWLRDMMDKIFEGKDIKIDPNPNISDDPITLVKKIFDENDEKMMFLVTGPLTDVARLLLKFPELASKIELVMMGGAVRVKGNIKDLIPDSDNEVAEWNIYADPKAAEIVFKANIPITLASLDATDQVKITREFYNTISKNDVPNIKLIYELFKDIYDKLGDKFFDIYYLWDPLAAIICVHPNRAETSDIPILMDVAKAQTKEVSDGTPGATIIKVALTIPNAKNVLTELLDEMQEYAAEQKFQEWKEFISQFNDEELLNLLKDPTPSLLAIQDNSPQACLRRKIDASLSLEVAEEIIVKKEKIAWCLLYATIFSRKLQTNGEINNDIFARFYQVIYDNNRKLDLNDRIYEDKILLLEWMALAHFSKLLPHVTFDLSTNNIFDYDNDDEIQNREGFIYFIKHTKTFFLDLSFNKFNEITDDYFKSFMEGIKNTSIETIELKEGDAILAPKKVQELNFVLTTNRRRNLVTNTKIPSLKHLVANYLFHRLNPEGLKLINEEKNYGLKIGSKP